MEGFSALGDVERVSSSDGDTEKKPKKKANLDIHDDKLQHLKINT